MAWTLPSGNGTKTIYAWFKDKAGNQTATPSITYDSIILDATAPAVPAGLTATAVSPDRINLSWNTSTDTGGSGVAGYKVYRGGTQIITTTATSDYDHPLLPDTQYCYKVASYDNAGNTSAQSAQVCATTQSAAATPELVGFVPGVGQSRDVVVDRIAGLVYAASDQFGLSIVDVNNPSNPVVIGAANPPFYGQRIAIAGSLGVGAAGSYGLKVVDISNPSAPEVVGSLAGTMQGVAMAGQFAYALQYITGNPGHTDLAVVNLASPSSPTIVGRVTLSGTPSKITVAGSYAYIPVGGAGLQIVDISNAAAPRIVSTIDTPGGAFAAAVANGYAYVADNTSVQVINVSKPANPFIVGSLVTSATNVAVAGNRLYTINNGSQLMVINVANPAAPQLLSTSNNYAAQGIAATDSMVYLGSPNTSNNPLPGLYLVDVTTPATPRLSGSAATTFYDSGVAVAGTLGAAAGGSYGLKVVDISNPSAPEVVGSLAGTIQGVGMAGQFAYALQYITGNPGHTDLAVVNLASPSSPAIVGRVTLAGAPSKITVAGSYAYIPVGSAGLQIVDISNAVTPRIVSTIDTPGVGYAAAVANGYAYVADNTSVQVINVSNPANPFIVGSLASTAKNIAVAGNRLYAIDYLQLKIIDVANPAVPQLLSSWNSIAQGIAANGSMVFLSTPGTNPDTAGVDILDASDPMDVLFDHISVPGTTRTVTTANGYVYAGDSAAVIDIIDLTP